MCDIPKTIKKCIKIYLIIIKQFKENGGIPRKPVLSFLPVSVKYYIEQLLYTRINRNLSKPKQHQSDF